jgi:hypothetical protein
MDVNTNQVLVVIGAILTTWVLNNAKLKEGLTDWYVSRLGIGSYNIKNHNVKETITGLKFESRMTDYDNQLKTELYKHYTETFLSNMDMFIDDVIDNSKLSLEDLKKHVKNSMYDRLQTIQTQIDQTVRMPEELQVKFDRFRNYLTMQHTYVIDNALQSSNKKLLLIQVCDAIENNARWFLFYSTEMFVNFNGHFDNLQRCDVFIS